MANQIRWKKGDYIRLGQAVAQFNKTKNQISRLNKDLEKFLPESESYQTLKSEIKTRNELNRVIKSLRSFTIESADLVTLEGR